MYTHFVRTGRLYEHTGGSEERASTAAEPQYPQLYRELLTCSILLVSPEWIVHNVAYTLAFAGCAQRLDHPGRSGNEVAGAVAVHGDLRIKRCVHFLRGLRVDDLY